MKKEERAQLPTTNAKTTRQTRRKRPLAERVALIGAAGVVVAALIGVGGALLPKQDVFRFGGIELVDSTNELNAIVTARWIAIDDFLKVLGDHSDLVSSEKLQVATLRDRVRTKHELHAAALKDKNPILAHERLRDLQSALEEVDDYLQVLRAKYPDLAGSIPAAQRELWQGGVAKKISYDTEKESVFQRIKRFFVGK